MNKKIHVSLDLVNALQIIATILHRQNIRWVVITSCGLALQGLDFVPEDIDILTDFRGFERINHLLDEFKVALSVHHQSDLHDSIISTFLISNCRVEVISNFKVKLIKDNRWYLVDQLIEYSHNIEILDVTIPCLTLSKSIELYKLMGRKKDMGKILKIKQFMDQRLR